MSDKMKRKRSSNSTSENGGSSQDIATATEGDGGGVTASCSGGGSGGKWTEELHRSFVEAIYDCGVSQSSPSVILENMGSRPASLTSERVKSHLQKYRKNKQKSKEDFMQDYDSFMRKALTVGGSGGGSGEGASHAIMPPAAMIEMMGGGKPSGGDIAAFLSYSVMTEGETKNSAGKALSSIGIAKESQDYLKNFAGTHVPFPQLTEEEKRSPLGISMIYVMGLFCSLSQHMMHERKRFKPTKDGDDNKMSSKVSGNTNNFVVSSKTITTHPGLQQPTSNTHAFMNRAQEQPQPAATAAAHLVTQQKQPALEFPWTNSALKQQVNLIQQINQGRGGSAVAIPPHETTGNNAHINSDDGGGAPAAPRPPRGFFHPIEVTDSHRKHLNVPLRSTDWNTVVHQPAGVPVVEAAEAAIQSHSNSNRGREPSQQSSNNGSGGAYAV